MSLTFQQIMKLMLSGLLETLYMTIISTAAAYIIGLPVGVLLTVTDKDGIKPNKTLNTSIGFVVNVLRSVPFIILLVAVMPITRAIVGTTIGSSATVVPLVIAAAPYIARMVESSIKEVDRGVIEASHSMGATTLQIVLKVLIPEAKPSLLLGAAISITTILSYSAMAGFVGGGGLGDIAIRYGYNLGKTDVMLVMVVVLVAIVQLFQAFGGWFSRKNDRRIR
ncbi:MAG: methionine ABC transporter permease [Caldicoprobacterales bacterium]|jgi:D-methionine transport system permease protein|nr:ABC transporter permease [Clostridia bacterium]MDI9511706.1 methionine ABC transporter permease [Bacillota bacterium]NLH59373.1 ABC transporter permease [Clostridiales bacterium]